MHCSRYKRLNFTSLHKSPYFFQWHLKSVAPVNPSLPLFYLDFIYCLICSCPEYSWNTAHSMLSNDQLIRLCKVHLLHRKLKLSLFGKLPKCSFPENFCIPLHFVWLHYLNRVYVTFSMILYIYWNTANNNNIKISSIYCYFNLEMVWEVFIYLKFWQCKNNMADDSCDVTKIIYFFNVYK